MNHGLSLVQVVSDSLNFVPVPVGIRTGDFHVSPGVSAQARRSGMCEKRRDKTEARNS